MKYFYLINIPGKGRDNFFQNFTKLEQVVKFMQEKNLDGIIERWGQRDCMLYASFNKLGKCLSI